MDERDWLAMRFEEHRSHLRAVAYRMLGSVAEADDAVQETWLRLSRSDAAAIENLRAWLTTAVARVCLNMLQSASSRHDSRFGVGLPEPISPNAGADPEQVAIVADSVGLALLAVLETLTPPERVAFVLHDVFDVQFAEIAPVVGRSPAAARKLASRARFRVRRAGPPGPDANRQRELVRAFLAAARDGDFAALLALLDPGVAFRADNTAAAAGAPRRIRGASPVAQAFSGRARGARLALVNGAVAAVWAPGGRPAGVFVFAFGGDRIVSINMLADPERLDRLEVVLLRA